MSRTTGQTGKAPPYGYNWSKARELEKNEYEQEIISEVNRLRHDYHMSHSQVAQSLTDRGYTSRSGDEMGRHNVAYIIKNVLPRERGTMENSNNVGKGASYGYMWTGSNKLQENPYEQKIINEAIELRKRGLSYSKIARQVSADGGLNRAGQPVNEHNVSYWFRFCIHKDVNGGYAAKTPL